MSTRVSLLALFLVGSLQAAAFAQTPAPASAVRPPLEVPAGAAAGPTFEAVRATDAYLATVPPDKKARSDVYFEGGYWIQLWAFLYSSTTFWLILSLGWSSAMRERAARLAQFPPLRVVAYWVQFATVMSVFTFPLGFYIDFIREHHYGMATQSFGPLIDGRVEGRRGGVQEGPSVAVPFG